MIDDNEKYPPRFHACITFLSHLAKKLLEFNNSDLKNLTIYNKEYLVVWNHKESIRQFFNMTA